MRLSFACLCLCLSFLVHVCCGCVSLRLVSYQMIFKRIDSMSNVVAIETCVRDQQEQCRM